MPSRTGQVPSAKTAARDAAKGPAKESSTPTSASPEARLGVELRGSLQWEFSSLHKFAQVCISLHKFACVLFQVVQVIRWSSNLKVRRKASTSGSLLERSLHLGCESLCYIGWRLRQCKDRKTNVCTNTGTDTRTHAQNLNIFKLYIVTIQLICLCLARLQASFRVHGA